jgi:hypothetical protein
MYKCDYCNKEYSSKGILENHQKTAKFCLKIRNYNNESEKIILNNTIFKCDYCEDTFTQKITLERHYERCKYKEIRKKDEEIRQKDEKIYNLKNIIEKEEEKFNKIQKDFEKIREDLLSYRTNNLIHEKELETKDKIIQELKHEIESLKKENKETINHFFEEKEKLLNTLINKPTITNQQNITNNTVNQYNIQPFTDDTVLYVYESYYKTKNPFQASIYNIVTGEVESFNIEVIFNGLVKQLKPFYGITDKARDKIIYNKEGSFLLTTAKEFINTFLNTNIDGVLNYLSEKITRINKILDDEYIVNNEGFVKKLTGIEKSDLVNERERLRYFELRYQLQKDTGNTDVNFVTQMAQSVMKQGQFIEKQAKLK